MYIFVLSVIFDCFLYSTLISSYGIEMIWVKQLHMFLCPLHIFSSFSLHVNNKAHQILGIALKFLAGLNQLCQANRRGSCRRSWSTFRMWSRPKRYGVMWPDSDMVLAVKKQRTRCVLFFIFSFRRKSCMKNTSGRASVSKTLACRERLRCTR